MPRSVMWWCFSWQHHLTLALLLLAPRIIYRGVEDYKPSTFEPREGYAEYVLCLLQ